MTEALSDLREQIADEVFKVAGKHMTATECYALADAIYELVAAKLRVLA